MAFLDNTGAEQLVQEIKALADETYMPISTEYKASPYIATLSVNGWTAVAGEDEKQQIVTNADFFKATGYIYWPDPAKASRAAYGECGIYGDDVNTDGQMIFHCSTVPDTAVTVRIVRMVSA